MHRHERVLNRLVDRVDSPSPIVLVDVMQRNIDRMQGFAVAHNLDLRPHVKTHKCVEVGRRQVEAGAVGITAGNVGEAEVFAAAGFEDIFLAYPVWPSGTKGRRICRLAATPRRRVGVDNVEAIEALAATAARVPESGALDKLAQDYNIIFPRGDLLCIDLYARKVARATSGQYLGLHQAGEFKCHHLAFTTDSSSWELWVDADSVPIPRRITIDYGQGADRSRYAADLVEWNGWATFSADAFAFTVPPDAKRFEFQAN